MILFDNFENDNMQSILQRYPLSNQAITSSAEGALDVTAIPQSQAITLTSNSPLPVTRISIIMDTTITIKTLSGVNDVYLFGLRMYANTSFLGLPTDTIGETDGFKFNVPKRITLHIEAENVQGHWFISRYEDGVEIYRNVKTNADINSVLQYSNSIRRAGTTSSPDMLIHKFVVAFNQEGALASNTLDTITQSNGTPVGTNILYTGDSLLESINKDSHTALEPRAYTDQFWAKIEIGEDGKVNKFRGAGNGSAPCFFSIGNNTPKYVENQQAIPTYFGEGKNTLTVEVARPMVLRFAAGTGAVTVTRGGPGYNFATQSITSNISQTYTAYNPATGQSLSLSDTATAITNIIGSNGGVIHIYPSNNYNTLTNNITITDTTHRLVEIIDFGTVCRHLYTNNNAASNNLTKLPNYLPMVINNLLSFIRNTAITSSEDIQHWDTSRVENFTSVFNSKTLDFVPDWDYSSAANMSSVFYGLTASAGDINIKTNAVNLNGLCRDTNLPNTNITIDAPNANTITSGFFGATIKSIDLNLVNITNMTQLFYGTFNTQNLVFRNTKFLKLFNVNIFAQNNTNFNFDLSDWCVPFVTNTTDFDSGATSWLPEHKPKWGDTSCLS